MLARDKTSLNYALTFSGPLDDIYMHTFVVNGETKRSTPIIGRDVNGLYLLKIFRMCSGSNKRLELFLDGSKPYRNIQIWNIKNLK